MEWKIIDRPGYFGKMRDKIFRDFNKKYGKANWRIVWKWKKEIIFREFAFQIYEDAYYNDSFNRKDIWKELRSIARDAPHLV